MPKQESTINGQWLLSIQDKHILKTALFEYMVDHFTRQEGQEGGQERLRSGSQF